jgi:hypothetical protein
MKHIVADAKGAKHIAVKSIRVRVFAPGNRRSTLCAYKAARGRAWAETDADKILDAVANDVEKNFPGHEYEMVSLGRGYYNFVCRGEKKAEGTQSGGCPPESFSHPCPPSTSQKERAR